MSDIFIKIFNIGMTAGWLVLAILLLRPLMRRVPRWINCLLWGIVGLRLIFPFSLESVFSLIPSAEPLPQDIMTSPEPVINSGIGVMNNIVNPIITDSLEPQVGASVSPMQIFLEVAAYIWAAGIALILIWGVVSYVSLRIKVRPSVKCEDNVYFCDEVDSPFILGVIRPRVYLPSGLGGEALEHVLAHERAHIGRMDHIWKPLGFVLLAVYWFNPLIWIAYALLCRDIEAACDEKVIGKMDSEAKKDYSRTLLACSMHRKRIMACPLAFGEVGVKARVKSVLNYKKPAFWVIIAALIVTIILSVCFLTNPVGNVRELLEPGSEWASEGNAAIEVTVDNSIRMTGTLSFEGTNYDIVIRYRNEGKNVYAEIYKSEVDDLDYDGNGDGLVGPDEYADVSADHLLLSGVLKARGDDIVLKIEEDLLGIGEKKLVFKKTKDSGNRTVMLANGEDRLYVNVTDCGSDNRGAEVSFIQATIESGDVVFTLKWKNKSFKTQIYGAPFEVYRYEGDELIPLDFIGYWMEAAIGVGAFSMTYPTFNVTEHFDISALGKYRLVAGDAWVEFEVVTEDKEETTSQSEINNAQSVFDPSYSFYDSSRKYDVYVWQMAQNSFSFGLLESKPRDWLDDELWDLKGVRASEMRQILLDKNLGPYDVNIVIWQNPISSYIGDYWMRWTVMDDVTPQQNMYLAMIYDMLFGTSSRRKYPTVYVSEYFDIDGDGERENNTVALGLNDGRFEFSYIISEDGKSASYYDTFYTVPMSLKFFTSEGDLRLRGVDAGGGVHIYAISLEDGHVKLTEIESASIVVDASQKELDLSKIDLSLVDSIVITNGETGDVEYLNTIFNWDGFNNMKKLLTTVKASDPVSNRGYYDYNYLIELYYDYQMVFSFSLYNDETDGARIICGYYETVDGFNYPCRYKLANPSYDSLAKALEKCFE